MRHRLNGPMGLIESIEIDRMANGWCVRLPHVVEASPSSPFEVPDEFADMMIGVADKIQEKQSKDPLIAKLQAEEEDSELSEQEMQKENFFIPRTMHANPNMFMFSTFTEVLEFLKEIIIDE